MHAAAHYQRQRKKTGHGKNTEVPVPWDEYKVVLEELSGTPLRTIAKEVTLLREIANAVIDESAVRSSIAVAAWLTFTEGDQPVAPTRR